MSKKKLPKKIQEAIDKGELITYRQIFNSYSKKRQQEIKEQARYIKIGMMLRDVRKRKRLSQAELAKKMNVKREFVSRIESGRQNVTLETLYRIGEVVGQEVDVRFK
jgi:DNA-binding XRE family transcriptional regulator